MSEKDKDTSQQEGSENSDNKPITPSVDLTNEVQKGDEPRKTRDNNGKDN